jgi:glycosyltransferase involved in cell wall biosynthesis
MNTHPSPSPPSIHHSSLITHHSLLSILIPVYNERAYLTRCLERVLETPLPDGLRREVILVDDKSTDGTTDLVRELAAKHAPVVRAFFQERNQGKGAAIARAVREMQGQFAIFQDADLEYDPSDYDLLLRPLLEGHADVVYGSRFVPRTMRRVLNYHHELGNRLLTTMSNVFSGLNLTDMETCYKAFRADVLRTIPIRSKRFGIEPEITAKIAKRRCVVYEVPISYHGRGYAEGKKIGWKDGISALATILRYWVLDDCYEERYGHAILSDLSRARRFNEWMAREIVPHLGQRILEVGAGIGNLSRHLPKRELLLLTDVEPQYLSLLEDAWRGNALVDVAKFDLTSDADAAALRDRNADTVVCLNVLEHVEDDTAALARMRSLLGPGGRLVLLVPQYRWLFGAYDRHLGHFRRYDRAGLKAQVEASGFRVTRLHGFNALAIVGWWINGRLLGRTRIGRVQLKLFDLCVPLMRVVEKILPLPGLSLVCVAEAVDGQQGSACPQGAPGM